MQVCVSRWHTTAVPVLGCTATPVGWSCAPEVQCMQHAVGKPVQIADEHNTCSRRCWFLSCQHAKGGVLAGAAALVFCMGKTFLPGSPAFATLVIWICSVVGAEIAHYVSVSNSSSAAVRSGGRPST